MRTAIALMFVGFAAPIVGAQTQPSRPIAPPLTHTRVVGIVWDSLAMKGLDAAVVRMVREDNPSTGMSVTTTTAGRFIFDSVAAGAWLATFLHPVLDSLRIDPGVLRLEISEPGEVRLPLATPSPRSLIEATCRAPLAADLGLIAGEVRSVSDDSPLVDAQVFVEWPEWILQRRRVATDMRQLTARTDTAGRYALCGVPSGSTLRAIASHGADTTGAIELAVSSSGFAMQDFLVGTSERVTVPVDTTAPSATNTSRRTVPATNASGPVATVSARRGRASVRGTVRTFDGRPIANAIVRVLGSGSQMRTDGDGAYLISDAATGTQSIEARAIGYAPYRQPVTLRAGETGPIVLKLAVQRVQLDTVRVIAGRQFAREVLGIERRMKGGIGTILDARTIRERATVFVSDALRGVSGVVVSRAKGYGQEILMRRNSGAHESSDTGARDSYCAANIVIDGVRMAPESGYDYGFDDYVNMDDVAVIEVYPRVALVPAEFLSRDNGCGSVVIWTKRATGGVMPQKPTRPETP